MTKEQWDKLGSKPRWDIIVAQRGPDTQNSSTLKWFTTSVIRGQVGDVMRAFGGSALLNEDLHAVVLPAGRVTMGQFDVGHFLEHINSAANWLGIPVVYTRADVWTDVMKGNEYNLLQSCEKLIAGVGEELQDPGYKELCRHRDEYLVKRYRRIPVEPPVDLAAESSPKPKKAKKPSLGYWKIVDGKLIPTEDV
jgi:hypothetical protein